MANSNAVWYQSDDGLKLYARDYPNEQASLTVLCMHGLTRNSADFEDVASALQDEYRVIAVDQRGRGNSEWDKKASNYTPARYVTDMFTLIDVLKLKNVVLLGTSMGGLMSIIMVAMRPDLFRGVVLNDIGPVVAQAGLDRIKSYVGKGKPVQSRDDAIAQIHLVNGIAFPDNGPEQWAVWVDRMYQENDDGTLSLRYDPVIAAPMADADSNAVPPDLWPVFDNLSGKPLLAIHGQLSDVLAPDCIDEMQRRHPDMIQVEIRGVGHAPMLDEPGAMLAIRTFLAAI